MSANKLLAADAAAFCAKQRDIRSEKRDRLRNHGLFVSEFGVETGWLESFKPRVTISIIGSSVLMGGELVLGLTSRTALVKCCSSR